MRFRGRGFDGVEGFGFHGVSGLGSHAYQLLASLSSSEDIFNFVGSRLWDMFSQ